MEQNTYYLDKIGYEQAMFEIKRLENKLKEIQAERNETYKLGSCDRVNSAAMRTLNREINLIKSELESRKRLLANSTFIDKHDINDAIDIGDIVKIKIDDGIALDNEIYRLVTYAPDYSLEIPEISINSPIGKAIYKKNLGDTVQYKVNDIPITVEIEEIIKEQGLTNQTNQNSSKRK